jgi:hypothetical protein
MDASDLLSTPSGYASPDQIKEALAFADMLQKQSQNQGMMRSPWQGVAQMTQAVMSGLLARQAAQRAQAGTASGGAAAAAAGVPPGASAATTPGTVGYPTTATTPTPASVPKPPPGPPPDLTALPGLFAWPQVDPTTGANYWDTQ